MTKEEKIQEAYGEHWKIVKDYVDEKGWLDKTVFKFSELTYEDLNASCNHRNGFCLPDTLQGIEDNNGWIKIESEGDLPKETDNYWVANELGTSMRGYDMQDHNHWEDVTHYQPIIKPQPPIY